MKRQIKIIKTPESNSTINAPEISESEHSLKGYPRAAIYTVGGAVGVTLGLSVGGSDGATVGILLGVDDGKVVGSVVGELEGTLKGVVEGVLVGIRDGVEEGRLEPDREGATGNDGDTEGIFDRRRRHHHIGERLGIVAVGPEGLFEGLLEFDKDGAVGNVGSTVGWNELADGELDGTAVGTKVGDELGSDEGTDVGQNDDSVGFRDGRLEVDNEGATGKDGVSVGAGERGRRRHHHIPERDGCGDDGDDGDTEGATDGLPDVDNEGAIGNVGETVGELSHGD